ncbi:MAG: carbon-nitrogen hydrolase family protein [Nitrosopumilaceae archaeon]|nr:carbon-nitrogen hydrolase family protein [Nitrosopumilaceae archaeon]
MVKLGIIQTKSYSSNSSGIKSVSKLLERLGKNNVDVVCLPEQWLKDNRIANMEKEFSDFKKIAKNYNMTIIPGAFYERRQNRFAITAPIIGPTGEIIGRQDKIHPFDYERNLVNPGRKANLFKTKCKFGVVVCYDMVFPKVVNSLVKKGAEVIFSPSRIVKRGILPWHLYVQTRSLENRIPILAANVENHRFGGNSIIVDLKENNGVMIPKLTKLKGEKSVSKIFTLSKYTNSRKERFADDRKFV